MTATAREFSTIGPCITLGEVTRPMFIQVGSRRYQVTSFQHASEMYCAARDAMGEGASKTPSGRIVTDDGTEVARISYNGRVWPAGEWNVNSKALYSPGENLIHTQAEQRGIPRRTLDDVKDTLAQAKRTKDDKSMARIMLKHGRLTDDARAYVAGEYPQP